MKQGVLKNWLEKGFGFISTDEGDVFAHATAFDAAGLEPEIGMALEFDTITIDRGVKAVNLRRGDLKTLETEMVWAQRNR